MPGNSESPSALWEKGRSESESSHRRIKLPQDEPEERLELKQLKKEKRKNWDDSELV